MGNSIGEIRVKAVMNINMMSGRFNFNATINPAIRKCHHVHWLTAGLM